MSSQELCLHRPTATDFALVNSELLLVTVSSCMDDCALESVSLAHYLLHEICISKLLYCVSQ